MIAETNGTLLAGILREHLRLRNLNGCVLTFDDAVLMTRACVRMSQVMVYNGKPFTLQEIIGDRIVQGATILRDDVTEFKRVFPDSEHSKEERI